MKMSASWLQWSGAILIALMVVSAPMSVLSVEQAAPATNLAKTPRTWSEKMRGLEKFFQDLLVDLNSDERYNSPKNFKRIERNVEKFAKLAHELKLKEGPSNDADPTIRIISSQFAKEADDAYKTLKWGHRTYARDVLKSMTSYCMACHTRNGSGPSFQNVGAAPAVQSLRTLEKGDFYASTRQFDHALEEYEKLLSNPSSIEHHIFDWEKAVRSSLAIAVRVKKDPDRALSIVERVLATPKAAFFLKEQASPGGKRASSLGRQRESLSPSPRRDTTLKRSNS